MDEVDFISLLSSNLKLIIIFCIHGAGFYAKEVAAMSGDYLPLVSVEHQYVVTKSVPEVQKLAKEIPVLRHMEASAYIRMERDGLLVGVYERPEEMKLAEDWIRSGVPKG